MKPRSALSTCRRRQLALHLQARRQADGCRPRSSIQSQQRRLHCRTHCRRCHHHHHHNHHHHHHPHHSEQRPQQLRCHCHCHHPLDLRPARTASQFGETWPCRSNRCRAMAAPSQRSDGTVARAPTRAMMLPRPRSIGWARNGMTWLAAAAIDVSQCPQSMPMTADEHLIGSHVQTPESPTPQRQHRLTVSSCSVNVSAGCLHAPPCRACAVVKDSECQQ
jgi:hypothetical protein